jgi:hypothetical protein
VFVIKVNGIENLPTETAENIALQSTEQTKSLLQKLSGWFESLKKTAEIKDTRSKQY